MVFDLTEAQWQMVNKRLNKFIWNKNYNANPAPHRIKKEHMAKSCRNGGFGLTPLHDIVAEARLRR
jgi:hypothetical protein